MRLGPLLLAAGLALTGCSAPAPKAEPSRCPSGEFHTEFRREDRTWFLDGPSAADGRLPLVVNIHGAGGSAAAHRVETGLLPGAEQGAYLLLSPQARNSTARVWDVRPSGDDLAYLRHLVQEQTGRGGCADPDRVYVIGFSQGAMISSWWACRWPEELAGAAPVAGIVPTDGCAERPPVPVLAIHGTADQAVPFEGRNPPLLRDAGWFGAAHSRRQIFEEWAARNGCEVGAGQTTGPVTVYRACPDSTRRRAEFVELEKAGHIWPTSPSTDPNQPAFDTVGAFRSYFGL